MSWRFFILNWCGFGSHDILLLLFFPRIFLFKKGLHSARLMQFMRKDKKGIIPFFFSLVRTLNKLIVITNLPLIFLDETVLFFSSLPFLYVRAAGKKKLNIQIYLFFKPKSVGWNRGGGQWLAPG